MDANGNRIVIAPCASLVQVMTDEMRVRQIITNGLTNAVKYSNAPENGAIRVVARVSSKAASPAPPDAPGGGHASVSIGNSASCLLLEVLDCGHGLRGVAEDVLLKDFLAPTTATGDAIEPGGSLMHVGSSGVGLPVCGR
jgi:hypothetical protein